MLVHDKGLALLAEHTDIAVPRHLRDGQERPSYLGDLKTRLQLALEAARPDHHDVDFAFVCQHLTSSTAELLARLAARALLHDVLEEIQSIRGVNRRARVQSHLGLAELRLLQGVDPPLALSMP